MALDFGKLNFSTSFNPTAAFPLDARCYFESLTAAEEAAASAMPAGDSTTVYHYGMTVCVVEDNAATLYIIQPNKTLAEVGSVPVGDGLSIEVVDDEVKLVGFGDEYYKYIPAVKDETGEITTPSSYEKTTGFIAGLEPRVILNTEGKYEIAWYEPSTETIEGVNSKVDSVVGTIDTIEDILNGADGETGLVKDVDTLQEAVETVEEDVKALEEKVGVDGVGDAATGLYKAVNDLEEAVSTKAEDSALQELAERVKTAEDELDTLEPRVKANEDALKLKANSADVYAKTEVYTKTEVDNAVGAKANSADVYVKSEVDSLVGAKANAADVYTKTEVDSALELKANVGDSYTKAQADELLADKAAVGASYTKAEADELLGNKANSDDVYTKTEADALLEDKANVGDSYTKAEADELLATKAVKANVYTKEETLSEISKAIVAADHLTRLIVTSVDDIDLYAEDALSYIYMVKKSGSILSEDNYDEYLVVEGKEGVRSVERVGNWSVDLSQYAKAEDVYTKEQADDLFDEKANAAAVYTKDEVNAELAKKADAATTYTIAQVDAELLKKANVETTYTKEEVDGLVNAKANSADVYTKEEVFTKTEVNAELLKKAEVGASYTKTEADGLLAAKVDVVTGKSLVSDELITKLQGVEAGAQVNVVKSVDIESGLALDAQGALSIDSIDQAKIAGLAEALAGKVDAVEGKGLSTEDFTSELKAKLEGINVDDIQANVIEAVQVNGEDLTVEDKKVNIAIAGDKAGVVKSSDESGKVKVETDGTMKVNNLDISLLTQSEDLILDGGSSGASIYE